MVKANFVDEFLLSRMDMVKKTFDFDSALENLSEDEVLDQKNNQTSEYNLKKLINRISGEGFVEVFNEKYRGSKIELVHDDKSVSLFFKSVLWKHPRPNYDVLFKSSNNEIFKAYLDGSSGGVGVSSLSGESYKKIVVNKEDVSLLVDMLKYH